MRDNISRLVLTILLLPAVATQAQGLDNLIVSNRLEYTRSLRGDDRVSNWLDSDLWSGSSRLGFRLEVHQGMSPESSTEELSQRFLEYQRDGLRIRIGNFYEKIGQGLLFQTYELQSFVLDRVERSFVLDRNADGVWFEWTGRRVEGRLFSARPLGLAGERQEVVRGADANVWLWDRLKLGASGLRWLPPSYRGISSIDMRATRVEWISGAVGASAEYVWRQGKIVGNASDSRGLYANFTYAGRGLGLSFEYKDYRSMNLPFNRPPPLIPTHSVALLNRYTHVLQADDERGYQIEGTWSPTARLSVVANLNAGGSHDNRRESRYHEIFLDARYEDLGNLTTRVVLDDASDTPMGQKNRRTVVFEVEKYVTTRWSIFLDTQVQRIQQDFREGYWNRLFLLSLSHSPEFSVALQADDTSDPQEKHRTLWAATFSYTLRDRHQITLMAGGRRAGLQCSGGICLISPEFRGIELRISSRL